MKLTDGGSIVLFLTDDSVIEFDRAMGKWTNLGSNLDLNNLKPSQKEINKVDLNGERHTDI